jgi:hypothetical protein
MSIDCNSLHVQKLIKIEHRMQICLRNPQIACNAPCFAILLREFKLNKKMAARLKIPFTIRDLYVLIKASPAIPLSGRSGATVSSRHISLYRTVLLKSPLNFGGFS